jgi:hypothetical protein
VTASSKTFVASQAHRLSQNEGRIPANANVEKVKANARTTPVFFIDVPVNWTAMLLF